MIAIKKIKIKDRYNYILKIFYVYFFGKHSKRKKKIYIDSFLDFEFE